MSFGYYFYRHVVLPAFETLYKRRKTLSYWKGLERSQWLNQTELQAEQFRALRGLLDHAAARCPYYRKTWAERGLDARKIQAPDDLRKWPLLDKTLIRQHRKSMRAENFGRSIFSKSTGGSTGAPLHFDLDTASHERRCAATLRGYSWAGATLGTKQFHLWGGPVKPRPCWETWKDRLYNTIHRRRLVNSFELSDAKVPRILDTLNRCRPDVVVAYTGALYQFARGLSEQGLQPFSPRGIIVGAEKLHPFQRETIEAVFQSPVFETYGSREFMLIGAECEEHHGLHLTAEHLYVDVLDDDGTPTPRGEVGNLVVTDLYNYGMPFIRYLTGDQAIAGFGHCPCGRGLPLVSEVRGRRADVIRTPGGRRLSGLFFPHLMKDFPAVRRFQVAQPSIDHLELRVVLAPSWNGADQGRLLDAVKETVGDDVQIDWRPVESIPLTRSGKHRVVVSDCAN